MKGKEDEKREEGRGRDGWRNLGGSRKGKGGEADGRGLGSVRGLACEKILSGLTRVAGGQCVPGRSWLGGVEGDNGEEARGGREEAARQSEADGWSAERQVAGKPETGPLPCAEGQNPVPIGRPEKRRVSRARQAVGIGGQSPREEMLRLKERPRISIGLRN